MLMAVAVGSAVSRRLRLAFARADLARRRLDLYPLGAARQRDGLIKKPRENKTKHKVK